MACPSRSEHLHRPTPSAIVVFARDGRSRCGARMRSRRPANRPLAEGESAGGQPHYEFLIITSTSAVYSPSRVFDSGVSLSQQIHLEPASFLLPQERLFFR
jgi:hypothetical protein